MIKVGSLFTGVGAFDLGCVAAGFQIAFQVDFDPYCQQVLHARRNIFGTPAIYGDVRDLGRGRTHELPRVDGLVGGFPCQSFSGAGKRQGEADSRNMWPEFARIINELRPEFVILENVAAILAPHRQTRLYPAGIPADSLTRIRRSVTPKRPPYAAKIVQELAAMGYVGRYGIISAADAGAPHLRKRWWLVAWYVGDANRDRRPGANARKPRSHGYGDVPTRLRGRKAVTHASFADGADVPHANRQRRQRPPQHTKKPGKARQRGHPQRRSAAPGSIAAAQPGLGRAADGAAGWLDRHQFPVGPGAFQYAHELPRTTGRNEKNRRARIKALGNALVPQIAYALAREVRAQIKR